MTRIYLAHPVTDYRTAKKVALVADLERLGYVVVDPDTAENEQAYRIRGMAHFADIVAGCDALGFVTVTLEGGHRYVTAGVAREIVEAKLRGLPVFQLRYSVPRTLRQNDPFLRYVHEFFPADVQVLSIDQTRSFIAQRRSEEAHLVDAVAALEGR